MKRRGFLKAMASAALTLAVGIDLLKAPELRLQPMIAPSLTDNNTWFLNNGIDPDTVFVYGPATRNSEAVLSADDFELARGLTLGRKPEWVVHDGR